MREILEDAKEGKFFSVKSFVQAGGDVNAKNEVDYTILHYATLHGSLEMVKYLVEHGADVHCETKDKYSVLCLAVRCCSLDIVKHLVENGADVNSERRFSILHHAVLYGSLEIVKYLVENGAKVTIEKCRGHDTVLFVAVNRGDEKIVDYLLSRGAVKDMYECDRSGRSLLRIACYRGNIALLKTLLKYKVDVRKEKTLECGNQEIVSIMKLELKKSFKHREKIENLKFLDDAKKVSYFYYM